MKFRTHQGYTHGKLLYGTITASGLRNGKRKKEHKSSKKDVCDFLRRKKCPVSKKYIRLTQPSQKKSLSAIDIISHVNRGLRAVS